MNYLRQIQRGVDFVEQHLHDDFALRDVSAASGVSHWHFMRMFKALTGETLKGYIRSRRLSAARHALISSDRPVIDIALQAGFESQASFSRAFRRAFGTPPASYRAQAGSTEEPVWVDKVQIDSLYLRHVNSNLTRQPKFTEQPTRYFMGLETRFFGADSDRNNIADELPALWEAFMLRLDEVVDRIPGACWGILRQEPPDDEQLTYTAAAEVSDASTPPPSQMTRVVVPGATYAAFTHRSSIGALDHTVSYIYSTWLPSSGRRHTYGPDLELYDGRYDPQSPDSAIDYAIPVTAP